MRIHCFAALEDAEPTTLATLGKPSEFVDPGGKNEKRRRMRPKGSRANIPLCPHSGTPAVSGRPHGEPAVHHMSLRSPIQAPSTAGLTSSLAGAGGAKKPGGTNKECLKEWRLNKTGCGGGASRHLGGPVRFRMRRDIGARWQERQNDRTGEASRRRRASFFFSFACFFHEYIWNAEAA